MRAVVLFVCLELRRSLGCVHIAWGHYGGPPTTTNGCGIGRNALDQRFGLAITMAASSYTGNLPTVVVFGLAFQMRFKDVIEYVGLEANLL